MVLTAMIWMYVLLRLELPLHSFVLFPSSVSEIQYLSPQAKRKPGFGCNKSAFTASSVLLGARQQFPGM